MLTIKKLDTGTKRKRPDKQIEIVKTGIVSYKPKDGVLGTMHDIFVRVKVARAASQSASTVERERYVAEQIMLAAAEAGLADCVYDENVVRDDERRREAEARKL